MIFPLNMVIFNIHMSLTFAGRGSYLPFYSYILGGWTPPTTIWKSDPQKTSQPIRNHPEVSIKRQGWTPQNHTLKQPKNVGVHPWPIPRALWWHRGAKLTWTPKGLCCGASCHQHWPVKNKKKTGEFNLNMLRSPSWIRLHLLKLTKKIDTHQWYQWWFILIKINNLLLKTQTLGRHCQENITRKKDRTSSNQETYKLIQKDTCNYYAGTPGFHFRP